MRGRLWRGWLWTPRIWGARLFRRTEIKIEDQEQGPQKIRAGRMQPKARWWHEPWWWALLRITAFVVAGLLIVFELFIPIIDIFFRDGATGLWPSVVFNPCGGSDKKSCGMLAAFLQSIATAALAFSVFYFFAYYRVVRCYLSKATKNPKALVQTATNIIDQVVGRDELCEVLVERIRDPHVRCPIVLVGGIGTGKTAVLVRLTQKLAIRNIVAVPIRLRDADEADHLHFEELARKRFLDEVDARLLSDGHGPTVWRRLRLANRIAVLADGLEEVLSNVDDGDRDSVLRDAIQHAVTDGIPLIITARQRDPLRGANAIIIGLEPLGQGAALEYGRADENNSPQVWGRIARLVTAADVPESPMFMRIIRDLQQRNLLHPNIVELAESGGPVPMVDRFAKRLELLTEWENALLRGAIRVDYANNRDQRAAALDALSAFACVGIIKNATQVSIGDLTSNGAWVNKGNPHHPIYTELAKRLDSCNLKPDREYLTTAIALGGELLVVDAQSDRVRFQHGVIHAYLSARFLQREKRLRHKLDECIEDQPGSPELLLAMIMVARGVERDQNQGRRHRNRDNGAVTKMFNLLLAKASKKSANPCWRLNMYATAVEISTSAYPGIYDIVVNAIESQWHDFLENEASPDRPLDEAKLHLVRRMGDAARLLTARRIRDREALGPTAAHPSSYRKFFQLAGREPSHRIRWAAAREIALGGRDAFWSINDKLEPRVTSCASGADISWNKESDQYWRYEEQLRGWVVPLLFLTIYSEPGKDRRERENIVQAARNVMQKWLIAMATTDPRRPEHNFPITSEIALAQGFRLAANIRRMPSGMPADNRTVLVEKAEQALAHSRYWYSQLILLQALTLLSLPDDPEARLPGYGQGANPYAMVRHWLRLAGSRVPGRDQRKEHPFLAEVGRLCMYALITRRPDRFCWIDESETASRVGSCSDQAAVLQEQQQWIPDSMGWSVLHKRAQRLLADVMLLYNLAHRGDRFDERELRLARADRQDLPPCITLDRRALFPGRTLDTERPLQPGDNCLDGCPFRLCPLPAKGERLPHPMDQNFCAQQAELAAARYSLHEARAPWQNVSRRILKRFWREMSERELPGWLK